MYQAIRDWGERLLWRQGRWIVNPTIGSHIHRIRRYRLPEPIAELMAGSQGRHFVVPIEKVLTPYGFGFAKRGWHPYVACLREQEESGTSDYHRSVLHEFHQRFTPETLQDAILSLGGGAWTSSHVPLPHSWPLLRDLWLLDEDAAQRYLSEAVALPPEKRSPHSGPFTVVAGRSTFARLLTVAESMREHGYDPARFDRARTMGFDGYGADGYFLWDGGDFRFVLLHGHHRVAAAAFLGVKTLQVSVRRRYVPVVSRDAFESDSVASWLDPEERLEVFGAIFGGDGLSKARTLGLA
jgi:hypothetical protein